jgi:hypothetical protein
MSERNRKGRQGKESKRKGEKVLTGVIAPGYREIKLPHRHCVN